REVTGAIERRRDEVRGRGRAALTELGPAALRDAGGRRLLQRRRAAIARRPTAFAARRLAEKAGAAEERDRLLAELAELGRDPARAARRRAGDVRGVEQRVAEVGAGVVRAQHDVVEAEIAERERGRVVARAADRRLDGVERRVERSRPRGRMARRG